jgi:hypothetical protein
LESVPVKVLLMRDGEHLYVAFVVHQSVPIIAQRRQDNAGIGDDDAVMVYLYPGGPTGFSYTFAANPVGSNVASSSENTAFAPSWQSVGEVMKDGYTVRMAIPLSSIKGVSGTVWRANFRRVVSVTFDDDLWSYSPQAIAGNDPPVTCAGALDGMITRTTAARPKPRFGAYALGEVASPSIGGNTSRMGLDASIPLTQTTSIVSTIHPDYSNVEIDQQTISPTAFPRYYSDVRPFFTQLQNYYNAFSCFVCSGIQPLYTTAIPTPRFGNAIEGKQGVFSFSAFDAAGVGRSDNAETITLQSPDQRLSASLQQVRALLPGIEDTTRLASAGYDSQKGLTVEMLGSQESGTNVTDAAAGQWIEGGIGFYDKTQAFYATWQRIGGQFDPVDGYVPNNNISGDAASYSKTWYGQSSAFVPRVLLYAESDLYRNPDGQLGQSDDALALGLDLQHLFGLSGLSHIRVQTGSSYVRTPDGVLAPSTQNGINFTYNYRTALPLEISYYTGRYGPVRLLG